MTPPTRAEAAAEIAHRADERAQAALINISRVEHALTDRIDHLGDVVNAGFDKLFAKLDHLQAEVSELKIENSKRTSVWGVITVIGKWLLTTAVAVGIAFGTYFLSHGGTPPPQH